MPGFLKKLIVGEGGKFVHSPSFEDFSLGAEADVQETLSPKVSESKKDLGRSSAPGDLAHEPPSTPSPTASKAAPHPGGGTEMPPSSSALVEDASYSSPSAKQPSGATLWGNVFHFKHRQASGAPVDASVGGYYDTASEGDKTTWEEVIKSERLQTLAGLPRTTAAKAGGGGEEEEVLDEEQVRSALGPSEDVEQLIAAARDGRSDARVPFNTFASLLRNS